MKAYVHIDIYSNACSSFICNIPKPKISKMSTLRIMIDRYYKTILNNKRKNAWKDSDMGNHSKIYAEWKKLDKKWAHRDTSSLKKLID